MKIDQYIPNQQLSIDPTMDEQVFSSFELEEGTVRQERFTFPCDLYENIRQLSNGSEMEIFSNLLSALLWVQHNYSGDTEMIAGIPGLYKTQSGHAQSIISIRIEADPSLSFKHYLASIKELVKEAYQNQEVPSYNTKDESELKTFVWMNKLHPHDPIESSKADLTYAFNMEDDKLQCVITYKYAAVQKDFGLGLMRLICRFLENGLRVPDMSLGQMEWLTLEESKSMIREFSGSAKAYPQNGTIHSLFEEQTKRTPDQVAVMFREACMTYSELNGQANRLARKLRKLGVQADSIVAIRVERSLEMMVGLLAILKAGGAYLPIDPMYPEERLRYMLEDSGTSILLTAGSMEADLRFDGHIVDLEEGNWKEEDDSPLEQVAGGRNLAYIIYTSGSTGRPKGVQIEHHSVLNKLQWLQDTYPLTAEDVIFHKSSFSFDISVPELFWGIVYGAKLCLLEPGWEMEPARIVETIGQYGVTMMYFVPSMLGALLEHLSENPDSIAALLSLRCVFVGGEALAIPWVEMFRRLVHERCGARLVNIYGPTETTVDVLTFDCTADGPLTRVPIGKPIDNTRIYILDENGRVQPPGFAGEIHIAGVGLARGYLNRPELTCEKFVDNPFEAGERMYRTGDLARWLPDGNVEFLGRLDHQIKLRGYRIELGEIESKLLSHDHIKEAVAFAKEDKTGNQYICAYITAEEKLSVAEIRNFLAKDLPEYMVPACFVQLDKLPLNANGKVDRKALPEPEFTLETSRSFTAPVNEREEKLVKIWAEVLGVERVGTEDSFYELGGHSLKGATIAGRINKELNTEIAVKDILRLSTVKKLADYLQDVEINSLPPIVPIGKKEYYPATSVQKRMYTLEQFEEISTTYNVPMAFIVEGSLDITKLENALKALIQRHESLRTSFENTEEGIIQRVHESVEFSLVEFVATEDNINEAVTGFVKRFDLSQAPLLTAGIAKLAKDKYLFVTDMHHIITDGISYGIFLKELEELYQGKSLMEVGIHYKDFAAWQEQYYSPVILDQQEQYWLDTLSGEIPVLDFPTDYARPVRQSFEGNQLYFDIDWPTTEKLRMLTGQTGTTMYMLLLSVWNILLAKYSGQEDILVGTPAAGRVNADADPIIGMFVNTLVMRNFPQGEKTYIEFLEGLKENCLKAYENSDYEFEKLVEKLSLRVDLSRNPIFNTVVVMQNTEISNIYMENLSIKQYEYRNRTAMFDMVLEAFDEEDKLRLNIQYCTRLFTAETIERIIGHLKNIIHAVVENAEIKLKDIDVLSNAEKQQLLVEFNDTAAMYETNKTIQDIFEEQASRVPDRIAVVYEANTLTYRELNERANQLARVLRNKGVGAGSTVAVMMNRSDKFIIGLLATLKAGGAYLPIDPAYPEDRINYMLEDSGAELLLIQGSLQSELAFSGEIICLDDEKCYEGDSSNLETISDPESLAYMIYTSGSTGKPKGVLLSHKGILNMKETCKSRLQISEEDRILQFASSSFDASVWEITTALMFGARLYIVPQEIVASYEGFVDFLAKNEITVTLLPPPYTANLSLEKIKSLRLLILGGSELSLELLNKWKERFTIVNAYGPTEITICASMYVDQGQALHRTVPIGKPITNTAIYIVDKHFQLQPVGVPGELCVSGAGLAKGYLNRPELTREKFVINPFVEGKLMYRTGDLARWLPDGNLEYLGRIDSQVKIRGYRIEPQEIENQMMKIQGLNEAAVIVKQDSNGENYLCAYFVGAGLLAQDMKMELAKHLPDYMIPLYFIKVDTIPLTPNGKVDKKSLPEPDEAIIMQTAYTAPANSIESKLVEIWQDILGKNQLGTSHNFFEMGGHSLKATLLISKLNNEFGVEISLSKIFMMPTIQELGAYIAANHKQNGVASIQKAEKRMYYKLSSAQRRMYVQSKLEDSELTYNMPLAIHIVGDINVEKLTAAFHKLFERHESLRTSFIMHEGIVVQKIAEQIEIDIEQISTDRKSIDANIKSCIKPFELETAPLMRVHLFTVTDANVEKEFYLVIDMHHIISDGISFSILLKELCDLYENQELNEMKIQYKDYAEWQRDTRNSESMLNMQEYWMEKFSGEIPLLNLPTDFPRTEIKSNEGGAESYSLNRELVQTLNQVASKNNVSLYILLLAGYYTLLHKYTGQEDIVVGSVSAGRPHDDLQGIIGVFVNTIAFRNSPKADLTFLEFLESVKETTLRAFDNQDYQFDELVNKLNLKRDLSRNPLFDTRFNMLNLDDLDIRIEGNRMEYSFINLGITKFDLTMTVIEKAGHFDLQIEYCKKLFKAETIQRMLGHMERILQDIAANPNKKLSEMNMLDEAENEQKQSKQFTRVEQGTQSTSINDQLDQHALPATETSVESEIVLEEKGSPYEEILLEVWKKALGIDDIGIDDDFFSSGGDSIKAIQMLTILNQKGLKFKVRDIFENITIRDLAKVITAYENHAEKAADTIGVIPLSPAQKHFFSYNKTNPGHYYQHMILKCQNDISVEGIKQSLEKLQEHHHALRSCFYNMETEVKQQIFDKNYPFIFKVISLKRVKNHEKIMEQEIINLQKSIDLSKGPMMNCIIFQTDQNTFVYIQIHHLVVDVVSWGVLLDDLEKLYNQYLAGKKLVLKTKTTSLKRWITELYAYSNSDEFLEEKAYWKGIEEAEYSRVPYDYDNHTNTVKDSRICSSKLNEEQTNILLQQATSGYKVNMIDLLLTALGSALSKWTQSNDNVIMFEGHGREEILRNINGNSTVGWFTSLYPLVLNYDESRNIGDVIIDVANQRNKVPNNGVGYGILKYLTGESHKQVRWGCQPQICFNYHGKTDLHFNSPHFEIVNGDYGSDLAMESERPFDIQFIVEIKKGELISSIYYNENAFSEEKINSFISNYENMLKEVIVRCDTKVEKKESQIQRRINSYMEKYNLPGIIVGIKSKDEEPVVYTAGLSDVYHNVPMKSDTKFRIGSLSKSFLATIVLQLVEEGILDLSDSIEKYIPDIVEKYPDAKLSHITLKQLLNHSSGLANNTQNKKFVDALVADWDRVWKPEELLDLALKNDEDFIVSDNRPWLYSNTNFLLAARIIESVTKTTIDDNFARLFHEVGLKNTIFTDVYRDLSNVSQCNTVDDEKSIVSYNVSANWAAGGIISDAHDMLLWLEAVREGKLLNNKELMFDYIDVSDYYGSGDIQMGLGIFLKNGSIGHDGFNMGCQTIFFGCNDTSVVIHTNKTVTWIWGQETEVYEMYADLISIL